MYRSSWICSKAVDAVAEDCTKRGLEINSEMDPGENDELMVLWKQQQIWDSLSDAIKWARLYGGVLAVLLIDGQKLDTPLRVETVGRDRFKGLLVLDRWMIQPDLTNLVMELGPNMGLPMYYQVIGGNSAMAIPTGSAGEHLSELYKHAINHDLVITKYTGTDKWEYIAESFTARLLHPKELEKRRPRNVLVREHLDAKKGHAIGSMREPDLDRVSAIFKRLNAASEEPGYDLETFGKIRGRAFGSCGRP